jgi:hypothetical protein
MDNAAADAVYHDAKRLGTRRQLWLLGYQMYLWDMRSRARCGRRIV